MAETMGNVTLQWNIEQTGRLGEGISRPAAKARTRPIKLRVTPQGQRPMLVTLPAETKRHAIRYAKARWPGAEVEAVA